MLNIEDIKNLTVNTLIKKYPFIQSFFESNRININGFEQKSFDDYLDAYSQQELELWAIDKDKLKNDLVEYVNQMLTFLNIEDEERVESLTIIGGNNKYGEKEVFESLTIRKSEIVSIVGPTGSGKSRLLADIEWTANEDTPTNRTILINGKLPDKKWRYSSSNKLVAQLSQNMNFVMDLTVGEFIELHAKSRNVTDEQHIIQKIIAAANHLAGEQFDTNTPITSLSGGQSRALMIADTAILSTSPIVLIDEIENAGIDRKKALELLISEEKIVLMATHDPSLALMADKRIVIKNGGIYKVIETLDDEKAILEELDKVDNIINTMRRELRKGEILKGIHFSQALKNN